jgi:RNA polymerase sigma-70 factor (ECF subfamily)
MMKRTAPVAASPQPVPVSAGVSNELSEHDCQRVFEEAYRSHAPFVWRLLCGMGVPDSSVEDALQDVFVVVHRRLPSFDGRHPVTTWLFAIACRVASNYRRRQRSLSHDPLTDALCDDAPTPAENTEQAEARRVLGVLLDRMDEERRAVFVLTEIEGMTAPEIAALTGVPLNTVYSRLRRARIDMSEALASLGKASP